jgi:predicted secreted protein
VVEVVLPIVRVAVTADVEEMDTDDGMPQVTGLVALDGSVVTLQVRLTVPVNPLDGVAVMVEVLPVVAPAAMETLVPARVNDVVPETAFQ